jgi:uncharacterized membrane protein
LGIVIAIFLLTFTMLFIKFGQSQSNYEWWNVSWKYRFELEINATSYNRTDWPIEYQVNFTSLLPSGTFDINSTRVVEYSSSGSVLYEVPSQFDQKDSFSASNNALGNLVFLMNGTTQPNEKRIFFVYYDTVEHGTKPPPAYATDLRTNLNSTWNEEFNVNNTVLNYWIDTRRGENTSGIIRVIDVTSDQPQDLFPWPLSNSSRTYEYSQFSNGTYNFTYNFTNNATLLYNGPVRMVVEQKGNETIWNSGNVTEGFMVKRYTFYDKIRWIKIEINFTNLGGTTISRNSTFAGVLGLDTSRAFGTNWQSAFGNTTSPGWWYGSTFFDDFQAGIIQVNQSGTSNFWVPNSSSQDKIGIQLNSTSISPGSSIVETAVFRFSYNNGTNQENYNRVKYLRDALSTPINLTQSNSEEWYVAVSPMTSKNVYNRNETVLITGNATIGNPNNLTRYMNATLDMGTVSTSDDQTIILYDDGTHGDAAANDNVFTNSFGIQNDANTGVWTVNFTAYTSGLDFLNSTTSKFNVTDVFNVTVNVINKKPIINSIVFADIYVKNYMQDSWISGATLNCSYGSGQITNKTDYNNGTYSINFTAPSQEGDFLLICNATKNGNFGNGTDTFSTEPSKANLAMYSQPQNPTVSNVSLYYNNSFASVINVSSITNGTAYSTNISWELLSGWSSYPNLEQCGDVGKNEYCAKSFNVTVPNSTSPGNYYVNATVTWRNPDGTTSSNKTAVNVTVGINPSIFVEQTKVSGEAGDGIWTFVGNFSVLSVGNNPLANITFSCVSGNVCNNFAVNFTPSNISTLPVEAMENVSINVSVPIAYAPGTYNGTINVSAQNDNYNTFILEVIVPAKTNVSITKSIPNYTASNITQITNETFSFSINSTTIKNGTARNVNVSLAFPSGWSSNSTLEACGNLTKGSICSKSFNITIPNSTSPGNYLVNISSNWTQPDNSLGTNTTSMNVTVSSHPLLSIIEANISGSVADGSEGTVGNFTILSIGNDALQNIVFSCSSGIVCQNFTLKFLPSNIPAISTYSNYSVMVNATVPLSFPEGTYNGTINVSAQNDHYDTLVIEVTVPANRTWNLAPTSCEKSTQQSEGTACQINVTNMGNTQINFTVSPSQGNYTVPNETYFVVSRLSSHVFNVTYNTTGIASGTYNSTFIVDAIQSGSNPDNRTINISLLPYIPPTITISVIPNDTEQNSTIMILANVTDRSGSNIFWTKLNVTRPNGTVDTFDMILLNTSGNLTKWQFTYPNGANGSTMSGGLYNLTVYARDNLGNDENSNSSFLIYKKLNIALSTLSSKYYQGDTGSIYYIARDITGNPVPNVTANFTIYNPQNNISYMSSNFQTNGDGTLIPMPTFSLSSDASTGNYTMVSYATYNDTLSNQTVAMQTNQTFEVLSKTVTVTGLFADIETAVVWYPDNIMRYGILVYNGEGAPTDPTAMTMKVYDPAGNLYLSAGLSDMSKNATGYYTYQYAMPSNTPSGMFLAVLNVTQGSFQTMKLTAFRVAHGGPYDLKINLLKNEVVQGNYLDFTLNVQNMGEVSQDVYIQYWVTSNSNATYYSSSEAVYTPALTSQNFTRAAYIYTNQPLGNYLLHVKMTYDSVQPPVESNASFIVISPTPQQPPQPPPPITVTTTSYIYTGEAVEAAANQANLLISKYNNNISLARGFTKIESVVLNNTGRTDLNNVTLILLGVPTSWFNITPDSYKVLEKGNIAAFIINFVVPKDAGLGEYPATLIGASGVVSDRKDIKVTVLASMEELLSQEIEKLKQDYINLVVDTKLASKEGKDTSSVLLIADEINVQIDEAEKNLAASKLDESMTNINNAKNLMDKARGLLGSLEIIMVRGFIPPWWVIAIAVVGIGTIVTLVVLSKRKKIALRPWIIPLGKIVDSVKSKKKSAPKQDLLGEKDKMIRMLNVLEKEKDERIISIGAYREMKKTIDDKLAKLEEKMK